jgi:hypothetical protein
MKSNEGAIITEIACTAAIVRKDVVDKLAQLIILLFVDFLFIEVFHVVGQSQRVQIELAVGPRESKIPRHRYLGVSRKRMLVQETEMIF